MSWPEFLGGLITLFFMLVLLLRPGQKARANQQETEDLTEEEELPKKPKVKHQHQAKKKQKTVIPPPAKVSLQQPASVNHYGMKEIERGSSRRQQLIKDLKSPRNAVVLREILGPPKGKV